MWGDTIFPTGIPFSLVNNVWGYSIHGDTGFTMTPGSKSNRGAKFDSKIGPTQTILQAISVRVEQKILRFYACNIAVLARSRAGTWHRGASNCIVARDAAGRGYRGWRGPPREGLRIYHRRTLSVGCDCKRQKSHSSQGTKIHFLRGEL